MNPKLLLLLLLNTLFFCCEEADKITLEDLYISQRFDFGEPEILIENIQSITDAIAIPGSDDVLLLGNDDDRNMFTCRMDPDRVVGELTTYGGFQQDFAEKFLTSQTGDLYILGGSRSNTNGANDFDLTKINYSGTEQWRMSYGTINCDPVADGIIGSEGQIILVGGTDRESPSRCIFIENMAITLNSNGEELENARSQTIDDYNSIVGITDLGEGVYGVLHTAQTMLHDNDKLLYTKTSDLTDLSDFRQIGRPPAIPRPAITHIEGEVIIASTQVVNFNSDILIQKLTTEGEPLDSILIESDCNESYVDHIVMEDGSLIILGTALENQVGSDIIICKATFSDGIEWCHRYTTSQYDRASKIINFVEEEIVVFAITDAPGNLINSNAATFVVSAIDGSLITN